MLSVVGDALRRFTMLGMGCHTNASRVDERFSKNSRSATVSNHFALYDSALKTVSFYTAPGAVIDRLWPKINAAGGLNSASFTMACPPGNSATGQKGTPKEPIPVNTGIENVTWEPNVSGKSLLRAAHYHVLIVLPMLVTLAYIY